MSDCSQKQLPLRIGGQYIHLKSLFVCLNSFDKLFTNPVPYRWTGILVNHDIIQQCSNILLIDVLEFFRTGYPARSALYP